MLANLIRLKPKETAGKIIIKIKERAFKFKERWVYNSSTSGLVQL